MLGQLSVWHLWRTGIFYAQQELHFKASFSGGGYEWELSSFNVDDIRLLHAAQQQARDGFRLNASLSPNEPEAVSAIEHAENVAKILRENVVQGKHVGDNKYSKFIERQPGHFLC